jgi:hypothetical protein
MLLDAEPRGLPGARIDRIQFQGAGDGFPLDDVVVHAASIAGDAAVLEIQAKHRITFSPGDTVFQKVAGQIIDALKAGDKRATAAGPLRQLLPSPALFHIRRSLPAPHRSAKGRARERREVRPLARIRTLVHSIPTARPGAHIINKNEGRKLWPSAWTARDTTPPRSPAAPRGSAAEPIRP